MGDRLLTAEQVADYLGITRSAFYSARYSGSDLPPGFKVGGRLRFRQAEVDAWLEGQREQPRAAVGA